MQSVIKTITIADEWTDAIEPNFTAGGHLTLKLGGSSEATMYELQASFDGGSTWTQYQRYPVFSDSQVHRIVDQTEGIMFRVGVPSGHFNADSPVTGAEIGIYK